jgi:hypothetical protein
VSRGMRRYLLVYSAYHYLRSNVCGLIGTVFLGVISGDVTYTIA